MNEKDDVSMCKRILNMINNNKATVDEIKRFCENYIKSKEEENNELQL